MTRYIGKLDTGYECHADTIHQIRKWAEMHGTQANVCRIVRPKSGKEVARHVRDTAGDGTRWFKATPHA